MRLTWKVFTFAALVYVHPAMAQNLTIYDDAAQNGFDGGFSYGGGTNLANTTPVHGGTKSIAFTGSNFNAVAFGRAGSIATADYPILHFWVHGGAAGGQQLRLIVYNGATTPSAELDTYVSGGIVAGAWHEVTVNISQAPFNLAQFDRFDIQSDQMAAQPVLYIDDIEAVPAAPPAAATLMQIEHGVTVQAMVSDRFTWRDSSNQPRVAVLAHNDGQVGPRGAYGGSMREFRYQLPNGIQRTTGLTPYAGAGVRVMPASDTSSPTRRARPAASAMTLLSAAFSRVPDTSASSKGGITPSFASGRTILATVRPCSRSCSDTSRSRSTGCSLQAMTVRSGPSHTTSLPRPMRTSFSTTHARRMAS
jgi:hypothetical protein